MGIIFIFAIVIGFMSYFINMANAPTMGLLYNNIDQIEGAKIIEKLKSSNIPYEIKGDGSLIMAPQDQVAELRMQFALDGIIMNGGMGYELFDRPDVLGTSSSMLDINYIRALEGELSKSIKSINQVQSARVHLVIPKRELFSKEKVSPSASVVLKMKTNQRLSDNQVQSIQSLVSSSVPHLTNDRISIIDDRGTLLARAIDSGNGTESFITQISIREEYEEKMARQLELLLEKTLGPERVRIEVSAEMDFDRITTQAVDFNPDGQVARTINTSEEGSKTDETNTTDSLTTQNTEQKNQNSTTGLQNKNASNKTEEITNFEISNKTTTTIKETGIVKRLSVAVLVDGNYKTDDSGKQTYEPRNAEELKQLTELVQTAIGYKAERNDSVKVINMKFSVPEEVKAQELTTLVKFMNSLDFRRIIEFFIIGIFSLIIIFTFLKPTMYSLLKVVVPEIGAKKEKRQHIDYHSPHMPPPPPAYGPNYGQPQQYAYMPPAQQQPLYQNIPQPQQVIIQQSAQPQTPQIIYADGSGGTQDVFTSSTNIKKKSLAQKLDEAEEADTDLEKVDGRVKSSSITRISNLVKRNPDETVALLRSWLYEEGDS